MIEKMLDKLITNFLKKLSFFLYIFVYNINNKIYENI